MGDVVILGYCRVAHGHYVSYELVAQDLWRVTTRRGERVSRQEFTNGIDANRAYSSEIRQVKRDLGE